LFLYEELSVLKVCIPPAVPFYTIPMVAASNEEQEVVFGDAALEKGEDWQLTWLRGGIRHEELYNALFRFVFHQPEVTKAAKNCLKILVGVPYVLVTWTKYLGVEYIYYKHSHAYLSGTSLETLTCTEDRLSTFRRDRRGTRYSLNISGEFTILWRLEDRRTMFTESKYTKVGFDTIVNLFMKLLCEKGYNFTDTRDRLFCHKLVMDYCYVALDFDKELERIEKLDGPLHEITLEDGSILELGKECIMATEVLFNPGLVGMDKDNIMSLFQHGEFTSLLRAPPLILSGGCASGLKGLGERILEELKTVHEKFIRTPYQIMKSNVREDAIRWLNVHG